MKFVFDLSSYDEPALDRETALLMEQRLEAYSRRSVPGLWELTDKLNNFTAVGPGRERRIRRYRIYGVILVLLGLFAMLPGLMEPRQWDVVLCGGLAMLVGVMNLLLPRKRKVKKASKASEAAAAELLTRMRNVYWVGVQVSFDEAGQYSRRGAEQLKPVPYGEIWGVFESSHAWPVVYGPDRGTLLQKKDLISGDPQNFCSFLRENIKKYNKEVIL